MPQVFAERHSLYSQFCQHQGAHFCPPIEVLIRANVNGAFNCFADDQLVLMPLGSVLEGMSYKHLPRATLHLTRSGWLRHDAERGTPRTQAVRGKKCEKAQ
eukprot:GHUV01043034.1.p1 GENE.GHUV01043034.1~~GHUV01043034.1.p1  ORF type:complete len:101 (-),score=3.30 GHUV01043034.1:112-414(-)